MKCVIDASIALKLVLPEPDSPLADRFASAARHLIAPDLLLVEAANGLWANARRSYGRGTDQGERSAYAVRALRALSDGRIEWVDSDQLAGHALDLAFELDHPVYDCTYLALALREQVELVTADRRFLERVQQSPHRHAAIDLTAAAARL